MKCNKQKKQLKKRRIGKMAKRWEVSFKTVTDVTVTVSVYDEAWTGGVTVLEAAPGCVEWADDDDEDVMKAVRVSTGYLRVMDNGDLDGLMPRNNMERYVEVKKAGRVVWLGYLEAATYSAPWTGGVQVVEYPMKSCMAVLEGVYMDGTKDMGLVTLGELMAEAIGASGGGVQTVVYPMEVKMSEEAVEYGAPWAVKVSRYNFFELSEAKNYEDEEYQRYDGITYLQLLEELCKLWGWTLMERGDEVVLMSKRVTEYVRVGVAALMAYGTGDVVEEERVSVQEVELADLAWADVDHVREVMKGANKLTVTGKVKAVGDVLPEVDVEERKTIWSGWVEQIVNMEAERLVVKELKLEGPGAESWLYDGPGGEAIENPNNDEKWMYVRFGGLFVRQDVFAYKDPKVKRYSYTDGLRIVTREIGSDSNVRVTEEESLARPVAVVSGVGEVSYGKGALVLTAKATGLHYGVGFADGGGGTLITWLNIDKQTNGKCMLPLSMRVGRKWWNGTGWQDERAVFSVRVGLQDDEDSDSGEGVIVSNQTMENAYSSDGYAMAVSEDLNGSAELTVYAPWDTENDVILLSDLKVTYAEEEDLEREKKEGDNVYRAVLNNGFKEEKEVELMMTTENDNPAAYSVLSVERMWYEGRGLMRPEEALLGTLKEVYGGSIERLRVVVDDDGMTGVLTEVVHGDRRYVVAAEAVSVDEEVKRVTLVER